MYTFLLVLLVLCSLVVIAAILLQSGQGQGLSASFGGASSSPDSFIGMRQAGNLLTQISWWGGGIFLALAFILQLMSTRQRTPRSVLEGKLGTPAPAAPAPSTANPAVPLSPLTPATGAATTPTPAPKK
jgi:preprotein translocase subunit SecG